MSREPTAAKGWVKRLSWHWLTFWEGAVIAYFFGLWIALGFCIGWLIMAGGYHLGTNPKFRAWIGDAQVSESAASSLCPVCALGFHTTTDYIPGCGCLKHGCGCRIKREQKEAA